MNNYTNSFGGEWSPPDPMKRYSMYLAPKGRGERPAGEGHGLWGASASFPKGRVTFRDLSGRVLPTPAVLVESLTKAGLRSVLV